jgi:hypothetical protein
MANLIFKRACVKPEAMREKIGRRRKKLTDA